MLFGRLPFHGEAHEIKAQLLADFLNEAAAIWELVEQLEAETGALAALRTQAYTLFPGRNAGPETEAAVAREVACLVREIDTRLRALVLQPTQCASVRAQRQAAALAAQFVRALRRYCAVERDAHARVRARIERQLRVVKPDATAEELRVAVESGPGPVFAQALLSSSRYGRSRAAYREVQMRRRELGRIDAALSEVLALLQQMNASTASESDEEKLDDTVRSLFVEDGHENLPDIMDERLRAVRRRWRVRVFSVVAVLFAALTATAVLIATHGI